jgi:hypothetical protein
MTFNMIIRNQIINLIDKQLIHILLPIQYKVMQYATNINDFNLHKVNSIS